MGKCKRLTLGGWWQKNGFDPVTGLGADVITAWGLARLSDTAQLLLGEVITNAVQHTVGEVRVRVRRTADRLRVEVTDGSDRVPDARPIDLEAENGRGLFIVQALADAWGHESVETTQMYLHADLRMKEEALSKVTPLDVKPGRSRPDDKLLAFLEDL